MQQKPPRLAADGQIFVFFLEGAGVWTEGRCSWQREGLGRRVAVKEEGDQTRASIVAEGVARASSTTEARPGAGCSWARARQLLRVLAVHFQWGM